MNKDPITELNHYFLNPIIKDAIKKAPFDGFVYFVQIVRAFGHGEIKIGYTKNPKRRIGNIKTFVPSPLKILAIVPGNKNLEKNVHEMLRKHRKVREWFSCHSTVLVVASVIGKFIENITTCNLTGQSEGPK